MNPVMRIFQDAAEDFRQAQSHDDLWHRLNRHLAGVGITGVLYGLDAVTTPGQADYRLLSSLNPEWLREKFDRGLFYADAYVDLSVTQTEPILWSDSSHVALQKLSPLARQSLDLDYDYGVTTGVTFPIRFADGLGFSSFGCHAAGMPWPEFDALWAHGQAGLSGILHAFDSLLRRDHLGGLYGLTTGERDCLQWLAAGLLQKNIADRMRLTERQVGVRISRACAKLRARTSTQAVARALVLGMIEV